MASITFTLTTPSNQQIQLGYYADTIDTVTIGLPPFLEEGTHLIIARRKKPTGSGNCSTAQINIVKNEIFSVEYPYTTFCTNSSGSVSPTINSNSTNLNTSLLQFQIIPDDNQFSIANNGNLSWSTNNNSSGKDTVSWTNSNCPDNSASFEVTLTNNPVTQLIYPTSVICSSDQQDMTPSTLFPFNDGTFSVTPPTGLVIAPNGEVFVQASTPNNYTIQYAPFNTNCFSSASTSLEIVEDDVAQISFAQNYFCISDEFARPIITGDSGGVFSAPVNSNAVVVNSSTGLVDLIQSRSKGNSNYTVHYVSPGTCPARDSITIDSLFDVRADFELDSIICIPNNTVLEATNVKGPGIFRSLESNTFFVDTVNGNGDPTFPLIDLSSTALTPGATDTIQYNLTFLACQDSFKQAVRYVLVDTVRYLEENYCADSSGAFSFGPDPNFPWYTSSDTVFRFQTPVFNFDSLKNGIVNGPSLTGSNPLTGKVIWEQLECPDNQDSVTITIRPDIGPTQFAYPDTAYCQGEGPVPPTTLFPTVVDSFVSFPPGLFLSAINGTIDPSKSDTGNYSVVFFPNYDCSAPDTFPITILPQDTADFQWIYPNGVNLCRSDTFTLPVASPANGLFSVPSGSNLVLLNPFTGKVDPEASAQLGGPYALTYTTLGVCGDAITKSVAIDPATPYFELQDTFCYSSGDPINATQVESNGFFLASPGLALNGNGVNIPFNTTYTVSMVGNASAPGQYWIEYQTASFNCPDTLRRYIEIIGEAEIQVSYPADTVCNQDTIQVPSLTQGTPPVPYSNPNAFFRASPPGLSINAVTGAVDPLASQPGTYTIEYVTNTLGCEDVFLASAAYVIRSSISSVVSSPGTICQLPAQNISLSVSPLSVAGGVFSSNNSNLSISPLGDIATANSQPGTYKVYYQPLASTCGLLDSVLVNILISDTADISFPTNYFCLADTFITPENNGTPGGIFYLPTGSKADLSNTSTGQVDLFASAINGVNDMWVGYRTIGTCPDTVEVVVDTLYTVEAYFDLVSSICVPETGTTVSATNIKGPGTFFTLQGIASLPNTVNGNGAGWAASFPLVSRASTQAGLDTIRYTLNHSFCRDTFYREVQMNVYEDLQYPIEPFFCAEGDSIKVDPDTTGPNIFAVSNVNISTLGFIRDTLSSVRNIAVNWNQTNCPDNFGSISLQLNPSNPQPQITYPNGPDFCLDGTLLTPSSNYSPVGGSFSSPDTSLKFQSFLLGIINLSTSQPGAYEVIYSPLAADCSEPDTVQITLSDQDIADFQWNYGNGVTFCRWDSIAIPDIAAVNGTPGGLFSVPGNSQAVLINASTGAVDLNQSLTQGSNFSLQYTTQGICADSIVKVINIDPNTAAFDFPDSVCYSSGDVLDAVSLSSPGFFIGETGLGLINSNSVVQTGQATASIVDLGATVIPKDYWITFIAPFTPCRDTVSKVISVLGEEGIVVNFPGPFVCQTDSPLTPTVSQNGQPFTQGMFLPVSGLDIDPNSGTVTPVSSTPGTYTIEYVVETFFCQDTFRTTLEIRPSVPVTLTYPSNGPYCANLGGQAMPQISPSLSGGTYISLSSGLVLNGLGVVDVAQSGSGNFDIVYEPDSLTCGLADTISLTILPPDDPSFSFPQSYYCTFDTNPQPVVSGLAGGTFSSNPNLVLVDPGTGEVNLSASLTNVNNGAFAITYLTNGNCPSSATDTLELIDEDATFTMPADTCYNTLASIFASDLKAGGQFTIRDDVGNIVDSVLVGAGTNQVLLSSTDVLGPGSFTVTYESAGQCVETISDTLDILGIDTVIFSYLATTFCQHDPIQVPQISPPNLPGGFLSQPGGLSLDSVSGNIDPGFSPAGTYNIVFAYEDSNCPDVFNAVHPVTIENPGPSTVVYPNSNFLCKNKLSSVAPLSFSPAGGTFSCSDTNLVVNSSSGVVNLTDSEPGAYIITYSPPYDSCARDTSFSVTVEYPVAQFAYLDDTICTDGISISPQFQTFFQGVFRGNNGLDIDSTSGQIDPSSNLANTYQVSYITASQTCPDTFYAPDPILILSPPDPGFTYPSAAFCPDLDSIQVGVTTTTGGQFSTSSGLNMDANTGTIFPDTALTGTFQVIYSLGGACPAADSVAVEILTPDIADFSLQDSVCRNSSTFPLLDPNASNGQWSVLPAGQLSINPNQGFINPVGGQINTNYVITYTTSGQCWTTHSDTITVKEGLTAEFTLNSTNFCVTSSDLVTPVLDQMASPDGRFKMDTLCPLCIDSVTGAFRPSSLLPGKHTITYSVEEGGLNCEDQRSIIITIHETDNFTEFVREDTTVCQGADPLQMEVQGNVLGYYGGSPGLNIDANGSIGLTNAAAGTFKVWYYPNNAFCADSIEATVVILGPESADFEYGEVAYCQNRPAPRPVLIPAVNGGFSSPTIGVDPDSGAIDLESGDVGPHWIYFDIDASEKCTARDSFRVNVLEVPEPLLYTIEPDSNICAGQQVVISTDLVKELEFRVNGVEESGENDDLGNLFIYSDFADGDRFEMAYGNDFGCRDSISFAMDVREYPELLLLAAPEAAVSNEPFEVEVLSMADSTAVRWSLVAEGPAAVFSDSGVTEVMNRNDFTTIVNAATLESEFFPAELTLYFQPQAFGCAGELDSLLISMAPGDLPVYIPEILTPDGNGENDTWMISWRESSDQLSYRIRLYNRLGGLEEEIYPLHDQWDGGTLPDGVYRWILSDLQGNQLRAGGLTIRRK